MLKNKRIKSALFISIALLFFIQCDSSPTEPESVRIDLTQPWRKSTPLAMGMDTEKISSGIARAAGNPRFLSLLVVRRGHLVVEEYFNDNSALDLNDVRSVTKSLVSTLTGIAVAEGFLQGLDNTIDEYLQAPLVELTEQSGSVSIRNLLTMSSGFQWDESGGYDDYNRWIASNDHLQFLLDRPIVDAPGTQFNYNSAAVHLLGVVLTEATEMSLSYFADLYLFQKIGIDDSEWEILSGYYLNGGAGIDLKPRDLARLGQLFLQDGYSGSAQILPSGWVKEATSPKYTWRAEYGPLDAYTYAYLWWVEEGQNTPMYFAWGYGGQFIFIIPAEEMVIVTTTNYRSLSAEGGPEALTQLALDIIINDIAYAAY